MRVIITGAAGFIGRKLAEHFAATKTLKRADGTEGEITRVTLFDVVPPSIPAAAETSPARFEAVAGDIGDPNTIKSLMADGVDTLFHMAAVVSAGAEADFDLGMRVNFDGTRLLLDACRAMPNTPRVVFASSVAVYGGDMPEIIVDGTSLNPQTSYGNQKAAGELLVNDYSRKGFIDGRTFRLPTVVVRPGKPNKAASTFASSIIREPLQGDTVICPVGENAAMWVASPRTVVRSILHGLDLPAAAYGPNRTVLLNGITVQVGTMVETLGRVAGADVVERIKWERDEAIVKIGSGWPTKFHLERATQLGFPTETSFEDIITVFLEDDIER